MIVVYNTQDCEECTAIGPRLRQQELVLVVCWTGSDYDCGSGQALEMSDQIISDGIGVMCKC